MTTGATTGIILHPCDGHLLTFSYPRPYVMNKRRIQREIFITIYSRGDNNSSAATSLNLFEQVADDKQGDNTGTLGQVLWGITVTLTV